MGHVQHDPAAAVASAPPLSAVQLVPRSTTGRGTRGGHVTGVSRRPGPTNRQPRSLSSRRFIDYQSSLANDTRRLIQDCNPTRWVSSDPSYASSGYWRRVSKAGQSPFAPLRTEKDALV
jgi:hypothetical protein